MLRRFKKGAAWALMTVLLLLGPATAEVLDRIVAIVNNEMITMSQLQEAIRPFKEKLEASQTSNEQKKALEAKLESDMLSQLVDASLAKQEAVKYGIEVHEGDVDAALENFKKANDLDDLTLERGLAAEGLTLENYRERLREQILQSMLINRAVRSKIIVTDKDVTDYYEAHKDTFMGLRKYHLRNILTETREEMETVVARLGQNEDFKALAKAVSIGTNASEGGELGVFDIASFSQEIRDALEGLEKGEFTQILKTGSAFQLIYVEDIMAEESQSLEASEEKIREILYRSQGESQFKAWIEKLKKNAHIKLML